MKKLLVLFGLMAVMASAAAAEFHATTPAPLQEVTFSLPSVADYQLINQPVVVVPYSMVDFGIQDMQMCADVLPAMDVDSLYPVETVALPEYIERISPRHQASRLRPPHSQQ